MKQHMEDGTMELLSLPEKQRLVRQQEYFFLGFLR
jgi:hypothetical protein